MTRPGRRILIAGLLCLHGLVTVGGTSLHALVDGHAHAPGPAHATAAGHSHAHAAPHSALHHHGCGHKHAAPHESPVPVDSAPHADGLRPAPETAAHDCPVCVCWSVFSAQVRLADEPPAGRPLPQLVDRLGAPASHGEFLSGRHLLPPARGPPSGGCA